MTEFKELFSTEPMTEIKAISLWEPWATLVMVKAKLAETRHWFTNYKGLLLICAAKKKDPVAMHYLRSNKFQEALQPLIGIRKQLGLSKPVNNYIQPEHLNFGKAVAIVNLERSVPTVDFRSYCDRQDQERKQALINNIPFGDYSPNRFAWVFNRNIITLRPFNIKGSQGFFNAKVEKGLLKELI